MMISALMEAGNLNYQAVLLVQLGFDQNFTEDVTLIFLKN